MSDADGSEDVNEFLLRIRELGDQRDKEDEERTRKLEEEILQGRKERQARRAERARSLSPTKEDSTSNAGTPHSMRSTMDASMQDLSSSPANIHLPSPQDQHRVGAEDTAAEAMANPAPPGEKGVKGRAEDFLPSTASYQPSNSPSTAMPLSRSGTLSWQQRPSSRGTTAGRSRPLSVVASENRASRSPRATVEPTPAPEEAATSKSEIAQSLGAKDPAYFRQTEDRGLGSAAYRKTQTDNVVDLASAGGAMRLPGLSREASLDHEKASVSPPGSARWSSPLRDSPSRTGSAREGLASANRFPNSTSAGSLRSPIPTMSSQRFEQPASDTSSSIGAESNSTSRTLAMSPSQGRMTAERMDRPPSPTKGLGGFVQSAMLKRSDSINKRWSAQAGPDLSRGNSIASNRSGYDSSRLTMGNIGPPQELRPTSSSRETSPISNSRPGSGHSNLTLTQNPQSSDSAPTPMLNVVTKSSTLKDDAVVKPLPTLRKDASSFSDAGKTVVGEEDAEKCTPPSPSKRWSPSKSSWLENAINKPDSPKPRAAPPQQPSWMVDLNRAKQQRGSVDFGRSEISKEVSTEGLMRSPPPGGFSKAHSISGLDRTFSPAVAERRNVDMPPDVALIKPSADGSTAGKEPVSLVSDRKAQSKNTLPSDEIASTTQSSAPTPKPVAEKPLFVNSFTNGRASPSTKTKPETPPKKDFTSTLKPRKVSAEKATKDEPEFKNVFGRLKKTHTQNYVAPDDLKDNILRGKAGLAFTGGPQKSDRKDEFKETILQKKEAMKAGFPSASTTITNASKNQHVTIPEALVKRQGLTRSKSSATSIESSEVKQSQPKPSETSLVPKPDPMPLAVNKPLISEERQKQPISSSRLGSGFNASLAGILSKGPPSIKDGNGGDSTITSGTNNPPTSTAQSSSSTTQLSHMTKGRAKGPKRRLPTTIDQKNSTIPPSPAPSPLPEPRVFVDKKPNNDVHSNDQTTKSVPKVEESRPLANISNNNRRVSQPTSPRKPSTSIKPPRITKPQSPTPASSVMEPTPLPTRTSSLKRQKSATNPIAEKPRKSSLSVGQPLPSRSAMSPDSQKSAQSEISANAAQKIPTPKPAEESIPSSSVKGTAAAWQQSTPVQRNGARSPIKLPTRKDEEAAHEQAGLRSLSSTTSIGLGIDITPKKPQTSTPFVRSLPTPPALSPRSPKSPPLPGKKPPSIANRIPSNNLSSSRPQQHNSSAPSDVGRAMLNFFGENTKSTATLSIDTQAVISSCSSHEGPEKIKTLRKQIFELVGDGKLLPVPSHQEHILFEENIYICTHVFGGLSGTRTTEVYLWSGDCVSVSAVEDAQLFARKVTKDNNGKLVILKQGKETSNFFQALGGIVITRRGSPSSSTASYMLCARRHVGQIAFDEVDFSASTLCKGFPYIISARFGKLYLWKGNGSGADELGCARLIGMDLGLTGEIEEVDEGQEPQEFWQAFPGGGSFPLTPTSSQYWNLKSSCEKYTTRMFTVEVEAPRPKSNSSYLSWGRRGSAPTNEDNGTMIAAIKEIMPFAQADMADDGVYVLDAFFELFVIVTAKSRSLLPSFRAALIFAQEYSILIASAEDRPFVPASAVVLGRDAPEGLKRAFRKWEDRRGPCVVLPLNDALQATQG